MKRWRWRRENNIMEMRRWRRKRRENNKKEEEEVKVEEGKQ